jgi:hypothetical protein
VFLLGVHCDICKSSLNISYLKISCILFALYYVSINQWMSHHWLNGHEQTSSQTMVAELWAVSSWMNTGSHCSLCATPQSYQNLCPLSTIFRACFSQSPLSFSTRNANLFLKWYFSIDLFLIDLIRFVLTFLLFLSPFNLCKTESNPNPLMWWKEAIFVPCGWPFSICLILDTQIQG